MISTSRPDARLGVCSLTSSSHCPWVYNCVGVNNHRHFFLYLINLTFGVLSYGLLTYRCSSPFSALYFPPH